MNRFVKEGEVVKWQGLEFSVMETPGYSRDAVTYLTEIEGKRIAFTGEEWGFGYQATKKFLELARERRTVPDAGFGAMELKVEREFDEASEKNNPESSNFFSAVRGFWDSMKG